MGANFWFDIACTRNCLVSLTIFALHYFLDRKMQIYAREEVAILEFLSRINCWCCWPPVAKRNGKKSFDSSGSFSLRESFSSWLSRQLINSPRFFQITSPSRARAGSIVDSNMTVGDVLGQPEYHEYIYIDTDILWINCCLFCNEGPF